jgi:hypothetical protein
MAANWESFTLQIPGQQLLEPVRNILETLLIFLEILKALLDIIKALLVLFGNPILALVQALIGLINTLFNALKQTGLFAWFDVPNPLVDPNFNRHSGGYQALVARFNGSLVDVRDPNRPQPTSVSTSGFLLLVVDSTNVYTLIKLISTLLGFFGKSLMSPQYAAPANVKVLPSTSKGDPILSLVNVFSTQPKSLIIEWSLGTVQHTGSNAFQDVFSSLGNEFVPPNFLIEKSSVNPNQQIDASQLSNSDAAGIVTMSVPTNFEIRGVAGMTLMRTIKVPDYFGNPFIKFQKYIKITPTENAGSFFLGQLGTFRYVDTEVTPGQVYWYRVRAFNGDLEINGDGTVSFDQPQQDATTSLWYIAWPGNTPSANVGKPSAMHSARIPLFAVSATFDVIANLKALFQLAFSLNFHIPPSPGDSFDSTGAAINGTPSSEIGKGSLTQQAGALTSFTSVPILGLAAGVGVPAATFAPDAASGQYPQAPWQTYLVTAAATRLATIVAGSLLNSNNVQAFEQYMTGPLPKSPAPKNTATGAALGGTLSQIVLSLTPTDASKMQAALTTFGNVFADPGLRLNLLSAVNYIKTFTLGGAPPDWIRISILRDIVPWSGQLLYELLAKIQALLDAFKGIMDEIIAFINLIERKINVLEQFIKYLISILDFILSLELSLSILFVPTINGDVSNWIATINNAGGTPPSSGPGGYSAGIAIAYSGPNVGVIGTALQLIF